MFCGKLASKMLHERRSSKFGKCCVLNPTAADATPLDKAYPYLLNTPSTLLHWGLSTASTYGLGLRTLSDWEHVLPDSVQSQVFMLPRVALNQWQVGVDGDLLQLSCPQLAQLWGGSIQFPEVIGKREPQMPTPITCSLMNPTLAFFSSLSLYFPDNLLVFPGIIVDKNYLS